ncbi:Qat anti-phage system TatD family nuclease QatD [Alkalimonas collagenimarina]|uniref:Qat anti-phage system TatD family nuclease QatD n=1 Tax=Alkalimonas collagenimarina TaxID=400390 RepID=A0ABT9H4Y9_9GAMM|nr:Qat anti-phage system TatD family nuclease QatD [Alkalimonas collagenimarina]MDP4537955.1 Qat anti-phage system TatD family nuclease QatD [Alkalimonas collagenimarina]
MMDLHCHVDLYPDYGKVLSNIEDSGFYVLSVTTVPSAYEGTTKLTCGLKKCRTALGLHPQLAHKRKNELPLFDRFASDTRFIGEIGLDGSRGYREHMEDQLMVFNHVLKTCELYNDKILTIHSLNAVDEVLACLRNHPRAGTPILHWFLAKKKQVVEAVGLGCYFSIGPAMLTSKRAKSVIAWIPRDRVLLETDGPFAQLDGQPLYPSDTSTVINYLAVEWDVSLDIAYDQLKTNLIHLLDVEKNF